MSLRFRQCGLSGLPPFHAFLLGNECPSQNSRGLVACAHRNRPDFERSDRFQRVVKYLEMRLLGDESGKPKDVLCIVLTFANEGLDESYLTALTDQFLFDTAEVEHWVLLPAPLQVARLPHCASNGVFSACVERRIAHRKCETIRSRNNSS